MTERHEPYERHEPGEESERLPHGDDTELSAASEAMRRHFASAEEFAAAAPTWMRRAVAEPGLRAGIERFRGQLEAEREAEAALGRVPLCEVITDQGVYIAVDEYQGAPGELKDSLRVYAAGFRDFEREDFEPLRPPLHGAMRLDDGLVVVALGHGALRYNPEVDGGGAAWYDGGHDRVEAHMLPQDLSYVKNARERMSEARGRIGRLFRRGTSETS